MEGEEEEAKRKNNYKINKYYSIIYFIRYVIQSIDLPIQPIIQ